MSIHDYVIDNNSGAAVRADINAMAQAIVELNSNASEPTTTKFPFMYWADTANNLLKQRNAANTAWIVRNILGNAPILTKVASYTVVASDFGTVINCSGTFSLNVTASSTIGSTFWFAVRNNGTGIITVDPNGAETIDGVATITLAPSEDIYIYSDGSNLFTIGRRRGSIITLGSGSSGPGGGVTIYLGPTESEAIEADAHFAVPYSGTIRNLYAVAASAPGAGETFTYTLRKNGSDASITATISGASATTASDISNTIAVVAGDTISVKAVTSAGTPVKVSMSTTFELISV